MTCIHSIAICDTMYCYNTFSENSIVLSDSFSSWCWIISPDNSEWFILLFFFLALEVGWFFIISMLNVLHRLYFNLFLNRRISWSNRVKNLWKSIMCSKDIMIQAKFYFLSRKYMMNKAKCNYFLCGCKFYHSPHLWLPVDVIHNFWR